MSDTLLIKCCKLLCLILFFVRTFSLGKCSASHFTMSNLTNAFDAKMYFYKVPNTFLHQQNVTNVFLQNKGAKYNKNLDFIKTYTRFYIFLKPK